MLWVHAFVEALLAKADAGAGAASVAWPCDWASAACCAWNANMLAGRGGAGHALNLGWWPPCESAPGSAATGTLNILHASLQLRQKCTSMCAVHVRTNCFCYAMNNTVVAQQNKLHGSPHMQLQIGRAETHPVCVLLVLDPLRHALAVHVVPTPALAPREQLRRHTHQTFIADGAQVVLRDCSAHNGPSGSCCSNSRLPPWQDLVLQDIIQLSVCMLCATC